MRQLIVLVISLVTFIGSIVGTFGTIQIRDFELRGYVDATKDSNLPFMTSRLGVNVALEQYSESELKTNLDLMQQSNFVWIRQFAYWDDIEPQQGIYEWDTWDTIINSIQAYPDLELVVVFMNSPDWARTTPPNLTATASAPPQSTGDFAHFASVFSERYGDVVDYYQIWDEPNLDDAWGLLDPQPTDYVAMLSDSYQAIHQSDPSATVISAALAPTTELSGQNISDIRFLRMMYQRGAKDVMDIVAAKPYGFSLSPLDRTVSDDTLNFSRIISLRDIMLEYDDGQKPLWASNWGWNSLAETWDGEPSIWGQVSQAEQTQYTLQALDRTHRELPWLGAMILHQWQPNLPFDNPQWGYSLLDANNQPTELLKSIESYSLSELPQNGLFHPRSASARYSGVWEFSELGADIGWLETTDSQLEFDFVGSDVALLLREGDYVAFLYPTVDGKPANATPKDTNGNPYIFLRSNSLDAETNLVKVSSNLQNEKHTLKLIADKGWDKWSIAGFAVSSGNLHAYYDSQISIGFLAILTSTLVVIISIISTPWKQIIPPVTILFSNISIVTHLILSSLTSIVMMLAMLITWATERPNIIIRDDINLTLAILTGGILYLSPNIIITGLSVIVLFILFFQRLETGLILVVLWTPFFVFPVELYTFAIPTVEAILIILTGACIMQLLYRLGLNYQTYNPQYPIFTASRIKHSTTKTDIAVIGVAIIAVISLTWTKQVGVALTELRQFIIEPLLFYLILRTCKPNQKFLLQLVDALILSGVLVALIGLIMYIQGEGIITAEAGARRLAGVYGSPNNVGLLLGRTIPFCLAFILISVDRNRRLINIIGLIIMFTALALTQSVGAIILGIPASIIIILLAIYEKKSILPILGASVIGIGGFAILSQISARFANLLDFTTGTNFFRLRVWESALEIIRDNPITGIGLDQFLYVFRGHYIRPDAIWDRDLSHPHNFILDYWARLGIMGVILFIMIQISFWRTAIKIVKKTKSNNLILFAIVVGLMGSMADLLAHGLIDNSVFVYDLAFIFALQLGLVVSLEKTIEMNAIISQ